MPPPPGAPGPPYVPHPGAQQPQTEVLAYEPPGGPAGGRKNAWVLIVGGIAVLALLITGGYFFFIRDGDTAQQAANSTDEHDGPADTTPDEPPADEPPEAPDQPENRPDPEDDPEDDADPGPPDPAEPPTEPDGASLVYPPQDGDWAPTVVGFLDQSAAEHIITEPDYADGSNWQALLATGRAQPEWVRDGDPEQTARAASEWFAGSGFGDADVDTSADDEQAMDVDGYDAYLIKEQYAFSLPGLEADGEAVYIVAVDLGDRMDVFIAAIPNTHPELEADAEQAIAALSVQ